MIRSIFDEPRYLERHTRENKAGARVHYRSIGLPIEVRQDEGDGIRTVEGYGLKWDTPAKIYGTWEQFRRGAFADTLASDEQYLLLEHNYDMIPYAFTGEDLEIVEDDDGLFFRAPLNVGDSQQAREFVLAIDEGRLRKCSIGFGWGASYEYDADYDDGSGLITYTKSKLYEISGVKWPVHESSELTVQQNSRAARRMLDEARLRGINPGGGT